MPFCKKLTPEETSYLKSMCAGMDRQLEVVAENLSSEQFKELAYMNQQQIDAFFKNSGIQQKLNELIEYNAQDSEEFIQQFYKMGAELGYENIGATLAYTTADAVALQTLTKYNFELIRDLNVGLEQGIRATIFNSVAAGEGYQTTMRKLMDLPLEPLPVYDEFGQVKYTILPRVRAEMIARTEHARAVNTGTLQSYANYGVEMVEIITARDDLVCEICEEYDEENPHSLSDAQDLLPAHPNCRCSYAPYVPELPSAEELGLVDNPIVVDLTESF